MEPKTAQPTLLLLLLLAFFTTNFSFSTFHSLLYSSLPVSLFFCVFLFFIASPFFLFYVYVMHIRIVQLIECMCVTDSPFFVPFFFFNFSIFIPPILLPLVSLQFNASCFLFLIYLILVVHVKWN